LSFIRFIKIFLSNSLKLKGLINKFNQLGPAPK
jgi:sRNA-binding regulator protein Hfq